MFLIGALLLFPNVPRRTQSGGQPAAVMSRRGEGGFSAPGASVPAWPRDAGAQALGVGVGVPGMVEYPGGGAAFDHGPAVLTSCGPC